jgi:hypothetical protein
VHYGNERIQNNRFPKYPNGNNQWSEFRKVQCATRIQTERCYNSPIQWILE